MIRDELRELLLTAIRHETDPEWCARLFTCRDDDSAALFVLEEWVDAHPGVMSSPVGELGLAPTPVRAAKPASGRRLVLTPASKITPRPVHWVWDTTTDEQERQGRFPARSLVLAAGRPGLGKSQFAVWTAAQLTRGTLKGCHHGQPKNVIYCTTEDSWEMTVAPRLIAAGADLDRLFRVDVEDDGRDHASLTLPTDVAALETEILGNDVVMIVLDPLLSAIDSDVDDYRSREIRRVLEPLVAVADRTRCLLLGLAHFNKTGGTDPLALISGAGAFGQLVRAAVGFARDDENDHFVLSQIKNNLGREDLPSLAYNINPYTVPTNEGPAHVSRFVFTGEVSRRSVRDLLRDEASRADGPAKRDLAAEWLRTWLQDQGGSASRSAVVEAGAKEGFSESTLDRARPNAGVESARQGFGQPALWRLPEDPDAIPVTPVRACTHAEADGTDGNGASQRSCERCLKPTPRLVTVLPTGQKLCPPCCGEEPTTNGAATERDALSLQPEEDQQP